MLREEVINHSELTHRTNISPEKNGSFRNSLYLCNVKKILMMTTTNTAILDESKLVARDMTPEELYAVIEQDIKAIYEADDVV